MHVFVFCSPLKAREALSGDLCNPCSSTRKELENCQKTKFVGPESNKVLHNLVYALWQRQNLSLLPFVDSQMTIPHS